MNGKAIFTASKREKGMALLFTLGILGLLLALVLAFAADSMNERKAASAAHSQAVANLIARSAINRVIGAMNWYTQQGVAMSNLSSHTSTSDVNAATFDSLWGLVYNSDLTPFPTDSTYNASSGTNWQYVANGDTGSSNELIGRFAYVLSFGSGGKLDPSACLDTDHYESYRDGTRNNVFGYEIRRGANVSEINLMNLNTGFDSSNNDYLTTTQGQNISFAANGGALANGSRWLDFDTLFAALGITDSTKKGKLKGVFQLGSKADPEAFWLDINKDGSKTTANYYHRYNLCRGAYSALNPQGWPTDASSLDSRQSFFNQLLTPALQYTSSTTGSGGGITWLANWQYAGEMSSVNACKYQVAANLMDYCGPGYIVTTGDADGNLMNPSSWSDTNPPAFIGHKRTPLLNEATMEVQCLASVSNYTENGSTKYKFTYVVTPKLISEIIDLYGNAQMSSSNLTATGYPDFKAATITGKFKASLYFQFTTAGGGTSSEESVDLTFTPVYSNGEWTNNCYCVSWDSPSAMTAYNINSATTAVSSVAITHVETGFSDQNVDVRATFRVQFARAASGSTAAVAKPAYLSFVPSGSSMTSNYINYCMIEDPANPNTYSYKTTQTVKSSPRYVYFVFQCDDPRMNLMPNNWYPPSATYPPYENGSALGNSCGNGSTSFGLNNDCVSYLAASSAGTGDQENSGCTSAPGYYSNNNNQHLSGAFIRNGSWPSRYSSVPSGMLSPAELGCIHRGKRWQTLNLCYYRDVSADPTAGGLDQASGDANILDQVKFTSATATYGKVNLNTNVPKVLQALFAGIMLTMTSNNNDSEVGMSRYYDPYVFRSSTSYGQFLDLSTSAGMATTFISNRGAVNGGVLSTRCQMLGNATIRNQLCRNLAGPKCVNEQLLCDFINLTKAEPDQTTMIIVAQAIKDVGIPCQTNGSPATSGGITIYKDWQGTGTASDAGSAYATAAGYADPSGSTTGLPTPSTWPSGKITNCRKGVYENGADVITAERKYYVTLSYDSKNCKWRILSIQACIN